MLYAGSLPEVVSVIGTVDPDANAAGAADTDEVDMSKFQEIMGIVLVGTMGSTGTIDFKFQSATTSGGSFADVTGAAITQLTEAGTDDDKQAIVRLRGNDLAAGHRYVKGVLTTAAATSDSAVIVLGVPRMGVAADHDLSTVDEIVYT